MKSLQLLLIAIAMAGAANSPTKSIFSTSLFDAIAKQATNNNIIVSPASIQSCLAMAYLGAEADTAEELKNVLQLSGASKEEIGENYAKLLTKTKTADSKLKIANRVYVSDRFELSEKFNQLASKYFESAGVPVNFVDNAVTAGKINAWIAQQTDNKIQNVISADSLDAETASVLVNAIYFKADWLNTFDNDSTVKFDFHGFSGNNVKVDMMRQEDMFNYGIMTELDATALEMSYRDTDITMLVVLPKQQQGLKELERKLNNFDLAKISASLKREKVRVTLPKFKIEYDISLKAVLEELGLKTMFTQSANFSSLVKSDHSLTISEVKHKAFIEVNEKGTTAAGATYAKISLESFNLNEIVYDFIVDHPFFFALKDKETIYFAGHVTNL